jgi:hypothetical protein
MEPILLGNGTLADQIYAGLASQGFVTGSLADKEQLRLLTKLEVEYEGQTLQDLYFAAGETNRLLGILT